jgi:hypothetical protein
MQRWLEDCWRVQMSDAKRDFRPLHRGFDTKRSNRFKAEHGANDCLWVPSFQTTPSVKKALRMLGNWLWGPNIISTLDE